MTERSGRTTAEWVSFAVACLVLLVVVGLIVVQMAGPQDPPAPVAFRAGSVRASAGSFYVPVKVVNQGDGTAADVQVTAALTIDGELTEGDQTIAFLAGDEVEQLAFVFGDDPTSGELMIRVSGFTIP